MPIMHTIKTYIQNPNSWVTEKKDDQISGTQKDNKGKVILFLPQSLDLSSDLVVRVVVGDGAVLGLSVVVVTIYGVYFNPAPLGGGGPRLQLEDDHHNDEADDCNARKATQAGYEDRVLEVLCVLRLLELV